MAVVDRQMIPVKISQDELKKNLQCKKWFEELECEEERPDEHTLLPLPGGVIIPGSRFREVYYWDSYWIIRYLSMFTFLPPLNNQEHS